jgi:hypothetical protein
MDPVACTVQRSRKRGPLLRRAAALSLLVTAFTIGTTGTTARADTTLTASVQVTDLQMGVQLVCFGCSLNVVGDSTGNVSGVNGTTPFSVLWPSSTSTAVNNFNGSFIYSSSCDGPVWSGATVNGTVTITGAVLDYGANQYAATVKLTVGGFMVEGAFNAATSVVEIDGGPSVISVPVLEGAGAIAMVPATPTALCPAGGLQGFIASGPFLAA